ncbi:MAG: hypothetical protein LBR60_09430 [Fibrobacter sp.]|jgi:hypothetical protein|nr:hypothetical protein [Fibrobacter sp.]
MKKIFGILFLFPLWVSAQEINLEEKAFSSVRLAGEAGFIYPLGDLRDAIENSYYGLAEFRYRYRGSFWGFLQFGYSYVRTHDWVEFPGVHQFNGRVGLDVSAEWIRPLRFGGGFSCVWLRADGTDKEVENTELSSNESEFGWFARADLPILILENYQAGVRLYGEQIWSLPEASTSIWFGIYVERRLW